MSKLSMSPLLVAVLGAIAHADGNTPVLEPLPEPDEPSTVKGPVYEFPDEIDIEGELVAPAEDPCIRDHPRGSKGPMPIANASGVTAEAAACVAAGGTPQMCDPAKMISMAAALCVSDIEPARAVRVANWTGSGTPRLVWVVQDHTGSCGGSSQYIDGWTGDILSTGACVYGRPCTTQAGPARARIVRRRGWAGSGVWQP